MITLPPIKISQGEPFAYSARVTGQSWVGYTGRVVFRLKRRATQVAFKWNGFSYMGSTDPIVTAVVTGDATGLMTFSLTSAQTALFPTVNSALPQVTSRGEITMGNGTSAHKYQFNVAVTESIDTVIQTGTPTVIVDGVVVAPPAVVGAATNSVAPLLTGTGKIGAIHTVTTGTWTDAVSYLYRWTRSGAIISGATLSTYTPVAADDSASLIGHVAGVNSAGTVSAYVASNSIAITYAIPFAVGIIPAVGWQQGTAITPLAVASYFTGSNITYSYAPTIPGIVINATTGVFSGTPTTADTVAVTVTATNSGGAATQAFTAQVLGVTTPVLSGFTVSGGRFQYASSVAGVAYWATTDTSVAALTGAALEAQATGYDKGTFAVGGSPETDDVTLATTPIGTRRAHLVVKNAGSYSNVQTYDFTFATGDTAAPVLSLPTATQTGTTTASGSVSTTEGNGILYRVLTLSATPPTAPQIKLGQNNAGTTAAFAGAQAVSATGVQNVTYTGLTASQTYYCYYMQEDGSTNPSNVAAVPTPFTTAASGGAVELMPDAGFDDGTKWALNTGVTVTGGQMVINAPTLFSIAHNAPLSICPVVAASTSYTMRIDVATITANRRVRVYAEEYASGDVYLSTNVFFDTNTDGALAVGTVAKAFTTTATTARVQLYISFYDAALVTSWNSLSLKAT